jgi:hypothetical protein
MVALRHQLLEPGVFAGQFLRALRVVESLGIAQRGLDLGKALAEFFDVRRRFISFNHGWTRIKMVKRQIIARGFD